MTNEQKIKIIEEILDLDEGTLKEDTVLRDLEDWDSVAIISFIAMIDDEFNKIVKGPVVREQKTVADLMALMEK
ncbi:acyl carrier protein [Phascolarctobacterium sp. CAG:266]|nr:acyl carrier protein [Phascolarctobacterium sp. CAG:266]